MLKRVCVYCASSAKIHPAYFAATETLARSLVKAGIEVVFGGGSIGLMGHLADTVMAEGGRITGIMPHFMREVDWSHRGVSEFLFVETMHERKEKLLENVDGLITLPGGSGTLEELLEAITLKRLGKFTKPIVILNTNGFYDPLVAMLETCIRENFMAEQHRAMYTFVSEPEEVIPALRNAPAWSDKAIEFATLK